MVGDCPFDEEDAVGLAFPPLPPPITAEAPTPLVLKAGADPALFVPALPPPPPPNLPDVGAMPAPPA